MSQIYISYSTDPIAVLDFSMNNTNYIFISFAVLIILVKKLFYKDFKYKQFHLGLFFYHIIFHDIIKCSEHVY